MAAPTVSEVDRIANLADPVIRNLQITQCYYELSAGIVERTGASANWCTFAAWASKQAGQTIRKDDLGQALVRAYTRPTALNDLQGGAVGLPAPDPVAAQAQQVDKTLWQALDPTAPFERASAAVARGNLKVFAEIGRVFAAFVAELLLDARYDAARITAFCAGLRAGPPPNGQEYLRQAFASYYTALFAAEAKERAERLLLANVAIGFHEQTRLQPEIVAALDAPFIDPHNLAQGLARLLYPFPNWLLSPWLLLRRLLGRPLLIETLAEASASQLHHLVRQLITEHMMTLTFADGSYLRLGHDLRTPYPESLRHIQSADLNALLAEVDPTPDSMAKTGATDWGDLSERLHFIVDMFRCFQENPMLLEQPFTMEQAAVIKTGRRPSGKL